MPSPRPLEYGCIYHIYNRGTNRQDVWIEERNYRYFLQLYARYIQPVADTYAYCLLRNHFHVLVRIKTKEEQREEQLQGCSESPGAPWRPKDPSRQFGHLLNAYAKAINKAYGRTGSLFQHPFGRVRVASDAYFVHLVSYIHHNPQKHGFVDDLNEWPYSSYHTLLTDKDTRLQRDQVLAWFGGRGAFQAFHQHPVAEARIAPLVIDDFD